jgi:hypothetical protein
VSDGPDIRSIEIKPAKTSDGRDGWRTYVIFNDQSLWDYIFVVATFEEVTERLNYLIKNDGGV